MKQYNDGRKRLYFEEKKNPNIQAGNFYLKESIKVDNNFEYKFDVVKE